MYRPQFSYALTPNGCQELRIEYSFDGSNTPYFSGTIGAGVILQQVPLQLDKDADFFLRGIQIQATALLIGLQDAGGHPLLNPTSAGLPPTLAAALWAQCDGGPIIPLEGGSDHDRENNCGVIGIFCRAGSRLLAYVQNATAAPIAGPVITLHGVKRFKATLCR